MPIAAERHGVDQNAGPPQEDVVGLQAEEAFRSEALIADGTSIATQRSAENKDSDDSGAGADESLLCPCSSRPLPPIVVCSTSNHDRGALDRQRPFVSEFADGPRWSHFEQKPTAALSRWPV